MVQYSFDEIIDRRNSDSLKYGALQSRWGRTDLLPLWVADMDFRTPSFILQAIEDRLQHPVLGYASPNPDWRPAIIGWWKNQHQMDIQPHQITFIPGIVRGIAFVLQAFTQPVDKVLVMNPVYHPFFLVPEHNGRPVVYHHLVYREGKYSIDFEQLDRDLNEVKVLVLSNPHNPGGRVWTVEELQQLAALSGKHHTLVISDEIHADLTFAPNRHIPYASVSETARNNSITFGSASKAFNMPGIVSSYSIVFNGSLRRRFNLFLSANELDEGNLFAQLTTVAAYTQGAEWLAQVKQYIVKNIDFVEQYCRLYIPEIKPMRPQASFLVYLDCHGLHLSHPALLELFVEQAHLALDDGEKFGTAGNQFMRLNVATPRSVLEQALTQLREAVENQRK